MRLRSLVLLAFCLLVFMVPSMVQAQCATAWAPNTSYAAGAVVGYGGHNYKCLQAHASLLGWEPTNVPALWQDQGACSGGGTATPTASTPPTASPTAGATATATTQPSATPPATVTPTAPPTATPTSGGGGSCAATCTASAVYTGGVSCSLNGHNWQAKWWTQGELPPGTTGVWQDMGACSGGGTPPPTATPTGPAVTPTRPPTATPTQGGGGGGGGGKRLAYMTDWSTYVRNWQVKNMKSQFSRLTHVNYAFGNVAGGACQIGDTYADYDKFFDASTSCDGVADTWDAGALRGNFNQLKKCKGSVTLLYSFGGWTWSGGFGQAAQAASSFASSCASLVNDSRWSGLFSGIDIDWEYPNACGLTCDSSGYSAFGNLMSAVRSRFGLVTAAVTANTAKIDLANYASAASSVNWYNVMTFDFFGAWDAAGPTAPHAPLYSYTGIPISNFYTDAAIQKYKSIGVPSSKLLLGVGAYGRGWTGVSQSAPGGTASGPAPGTWEPGNEDYYVIASRCPSSGTVGGTSYSYCGGQWWGFDTPSTLSGKMSYVVNQGLGGSFMWELSGDRTNVFVGALR